MIHLPKSQPAPECLNAEKLKAGGDYKCGDVISRLQTDFMNKCYICEKRGMTTINVEHFIPHRGKNKDLEFDWNNLFFACGHCNNTKLAKAVYDDILNCTIPTDSPDTKIKYKVNPFPKEKPIITAIENTLKVQNTVELLNAVFNGKTMTKSIEADNLRDLLVREIRAFQNLLFEYDDYKYSESPIKTDIKNKIILDLEPSSHFTAFKRWIIRDSEYLSNEFGAFCN